MFVVTNALKLRYCTLHNNLTWINRITTSKKQKLFRPKHQSEEACHTYRSALSLCIPPEPDRLHTHHTGSCDELEAAKILVYQRATVCHHEWQAAAARQQVQVIRKTLSGDYSLLSVVSVFVLSSSLIQFMAVKHYDKITNTFDPNYLLHSLLLFFLNYNMQFLRSCQWTSQEWDHSWFLHSLNFPELVLKPVVQDVISSRKDVMSWKATETTTRTPLKGQY